MPLGTTGTMGPRGATSAGWMAGGALVMSPGLLGSLGLGDSAGLEGVAGVAGVIAGVVGVPEAATGGSSRGLSRAAGPAGRAGRGVTK